MSPPIDRTTTTAAASPRREQRPWLKAEDAEGWTVAARAKGRRRRIALSVAIDFDLDQSAWLRAEAERTGLEYDDLVKRAVDAARGCGAT